MTDLRKLTPPDVYADILTPTIKPPPEAAAANELADAVRQLVRTTVGSSASDEVLRQVATEVRALVEKLDPHIGMTRTDQGRRISGEGNFMTHPIIGPANPSAPPLKLHIDGDTVSGTVVFGPPQEGPDHCAHGGWIAAGFDAILLMAAGAKGVGGPTKSLSVRYRRPTPINTPLRYEATVDVVEERRVVIHGRLLNGDEVCAEGTAEVARLQRPPTTEPTT